MPKSIVAAALLLLWLPFLAKAQTTKYIEHKVRWMENIYTISRKYQVDPNTVLEYNKITAKDVRRGITLLIPVVSVENQGITQPNTPVLVDPDDVRNRIRYDCNEYRPALGTVHKISLILPFQLQDAHPNPSFLEFYEGVLLAVKDLEKELEEEGVRILLSLYDSGGYSWLSSLVESGALHDQELIIGPVYAADVFDLVNYSFGRHFKVVSPLDPQTESAAYANPSFFQVNTSLYRQQSNLIQCLPPHPGMVWLFSEELGSDEELVNTTKEVLRENHIIFREFTHKVAKDHDITGELSLMFAQGQNNHVIVASTNEAFVSDVLRSLNLARAIHNCPITLYGNARWRNFESVDLEYYHNMYLHLAVTNYVDYQRPEVKRFLSRFRALYRTEPTAYAFHGYDVGYYFIRALLTKGPMFDNCMEQGYIPALPLQSNFRFQKASAEGGFINTGTRIIRYLPDFKIEVIR